MTRQNKKKKNKEDKISEKNVTALHELKLGRLGAGRGNKKAADKRKAVAIGFAKARKEELLAPSRQDSRPLQSKITKKAKT